MADAYICDFVRTPIGRYGGVLKDVRTDDLAATANPNSMGNSAIPGVRNAGDMKRALEIIATEGPGTLVKELSPRLATP